MIPADAYHSDFPNHWCPGCGNFGILDALKGALAGLALAPEKILVVSGIGQAAKMPHFLRCNCFHSLHGRALPIATGAKIANHRMTILVSTGDGDCYGEGGNHFMHAIRRNIDVTVLAHNNGVYGLTKGQASPTSMVGMQTKMQPGGVLSGAFNPLAVALSLGAGFVARGFSGDGEQLQKLIAAGIGHKGFALIDILQPCVSFNRLNTHKWYKDRVEPIAESYDTTDLMAALGLALRTDDRISTGIYYRRQAPSYTDRIEKLKDGPLTDRRYDPAPLRALLSA
ncbi:MAG: 2-oxoacid:ferredoxin oxidoreductase subunit beta [Pseudomonadota bacterium]